LLLAFQARFAVQATPYVPADAHALADLQSFLSRNITQCDHPADGFVAWYQRIRRDAPFIVKHRQIGVADTAVLYRNVNVFRPQLTGVIRILL
jgi:hypothetical protein